MICAAVPWTDPGKEQGMNKTGKLRWKTAGLLTGLFMMAVMALGQTQTASAAGNWTGAKQAVIKAYQNYESVVNLESYNLNYETEHDQLTTMMGDVVNRTPYLFYAGTRYSVSHKSTSKKIVSIQLGYADDYVKADGTVRKTKIRNTTTKLNQAIDGIMTQVKDGMTDIEKAMILHDYIVSNTAYSSKVNKQYRKTEVGPLLKGSGNCQGYSLAYAMLLQKADIETRFVVSTSMSHMWVAMKYKKDWYHIDPTWDDALNPDNSKDQYGVVFHKYFMCSAARFEKLDHTGFDTTIGTNTKFDKKYWKSVNSAFQYNGKTWLYLNSKGVVERTHLDSGKAAVKFNVSASNLIRFNDNKYYYIAYNNIYLYNYSKNTAAIAWKTADTYTADYELSEIKIKDSYLYYRVRNAEKTYVTKKLALDASGGLTK